MIDVLIYCVYNYSTLPEEQVLINFPQLKTSRPASHASHAWLPQASGKILSGD